MLKKFAYDLNAIDGVTKFVLAHLFVDKRTKKKCYEFLKQVKDNCYEQIQRFPMIVLRFVRASLSRHSRFLVSQLTGMSILEIFEKEKHKKVRDRKLIEFICDKFANYKSAFMKLFGRVCKLTFGVPIACKKYGLEHNNNYAERYNGKLEDRIKTIRGGFGSFEGAKDFMNLRRIIHNFVKSNQQLQGKTPAEMADIFLPLRFCR